MIVTDVQDQAIAARMALIVGADRSDRLFGAVRFDEVDGDRARKCPFCAEYIKREAIVCKHCGRDLVPKDAGSAA
ncbi:hypothetical protein ABIA06_003136 [Bradyrhizobium yuanmingense]